MRAMYCSGLEAVERYRPFARVVRLFRAPAVIHCTSRLGLDGILREGAITPNRGERRFTMNVDFYARQRGLVCLFDFWTPTLGQCLFNAQWIGVDKWWALFTEHDPTVAILIDPSALDIIPNSAAFAEFGKWSGPGVPFYIPRVEVWHRGALPRSAFRAYVVMPAGQPEASIIIPESDNPLPAIDRVVRRFRRERRRTGWS